MKKIQLTISLLIFSLFLVACDQNSSPISDDDIKTTERNNSNEETRTLSELSINSLDDVISVKLPSSFYQQAGHLQETINLPANSQLEGLFHDSISNISFYISNHGKTAKNAEQYLADLKNSIEQKNNFKNINIELNDNQQITYQYTISAADTKLNESCVAIITDTLYTLCAFSDNQDFTALNNTLKQISVKTDTADTNN